MKKTVFLLCLALMTLSCERDDYHYGYSNGTEIVFDEPTNPLMEGQWVYREYSFPGDEVYTTTYSLIFYTSKDVIYRVISNNPEDNEPVTREWTYKFNKDEGRIYQTTADGGIYESEIEYSDELETLFWKRSMYDMAKVLRRENL